MIEGGEAAVCAACGTQGHYATHCPAGDPRAERPDFPWFLDGRPL